MKVIRTFNKAQEIFKNKLSKPFKQKNVELVIENQINSIKLKCKIDSTIKLYKLYKYNKFFTSRLKFLSKRFIFFSQKNIKYFILNKFILILKSILRTQNFSKINLTFVTRLKKKISFLQKSFFQLLSKNLFLIKTKKEFKTSLVQLKKIFFLIFFEYQIFIGNRCKKDFNSINNDLNLFFSRLKKTEGIQKLSYKLKSFSLELKQLIEKTIINFNYSNIPIEKYLKRIWLIFKIYYIPSIILIKNLIKVCNNSLIINYLPYLRNLVPKLLKSEEVDFPLFLIYYSLFSRPTNPLSFPKETIQNGVFAQMYLLISIAASFGISLIRTLLDSSRLLVNMYLQLFVLRKFRVLALNKGVVRNLKPNNNFGITGSEKYIERFISESDSFINSSILSPIFIILIITLLYNCCYYIIYNKQPYIPILTDLAKRQTPNTQRD